MSITTRASRPLAALVALALAASAQAAVPAGTSNGLTLGVAAPDAGVERSDGRYAADGAAIELYAPAYRARRAGAEQMAREFVAARHVQLGLAGSELANLELAAVRANAGFSVVRLRQVQQGLPVFGSDLAISVAPDGAVLFAANATVRGLAPVDTTARISEAQGLALARQYLGTAATRHESIGKTIYQAGDRTHLAWHVAVIATDGLRGTWEVLVDAHSGEVLRAEDTNAYVDGTAMVFDPDPLSSTGSTYGQTGYVDGGDADTPQLTAARVPVTLKDITFSGGNYSLAGPYAVCWEWEAPNDGDCPLQASSHFDYTRSQLHFEAVNGYHHLDTFMRYVNETLGVTAMPVRYTGGVRYDAHGENGDDNAHYSRVTDEIVFGQGGVDDAEDADVLIHELGHAIHNWVSNGGLSQQQGLSEGTGDYLAMAYSHDYPGQWTPADPAYYWVFSWDGHNSIWAGRVTNYQMQRTYQNLPSAIHTAGQYWASCNREAREAIGGLAMDKAFLEGLAMTTSSSNQKAAAQAVINAAAALGYSQAQIDAIGVAYNSGNTGGNTGCTYDVIVPTAIAGPVAGVDVASIEATVEAGEATTAAFSISNTGTAALDWNVDTSASAACTTPVGTPWLSLAPVSGSIAAGAAPTSVTVTLDAGALGAGSYDAYVCVHSNDGATPVIALPVEFVVEQPDDTLFRDGFDPAPPEACQLLQDPSFEATDPVSYENPFWESTSTNWGDSLCFSDGCDDLPAHTGEVFAYFGGFQTETPAEVATVSQTVTIPAGRDYLLNFWMSRPYVSAPFNDVVTVKVDSTVVATYNEPATAEPGYALQSIDVSAYADGGAHTITIEYRHPGDGVMSDVLVDDVTLDCVL
ncbi:MAG: PepSY domain-containing protein [Xanthomonadales bacterium]|nr:PepSY domain-containing protein [Xanthomonadales bacterium]